MKDAKITDDDKFIEIFDKLKSVHPSDAELGKLYIGFSKFTVTDKKRFTVYIGVKINPVDCDGCMFDSFVGIGGKTARYRLCLSREFDSDESFVMSTEHLNPIEAFDLFYYLLNKFEGADLEKHIQLKWKADKRFNENKRTEK